MSRSSQLYELQQIDSQLDRHRNRLLQIQAILSDNREIQSAEGTLKAAQTALKIAERNLKEAEQKVKDQRLKIKLTETKLYSGKIRNPKELQDLQDESEALKRFLEVVEDRQLTCMLDLDSHRDIYESTQHNYNQVRQKFEKIHEELTQEKNGIRQEMHQLEKVRITKAQAIATDDLAVYENLRKQRYGIAVSSVNDKACSACGATLTAALHQAARSPSQITYCEACGRILYAN